MGNIGRTQGLEPIVDAFESAIELAEMDAELVITGTGVAFDAVSSRVRSTRVSMLGVVHGEELDALLRSSALGLVSQKPDLKEFNLPSKLMNYMAYGMPIIASVDSDSETARIVRDSGAGWVTDPADPGAFARQAALAMRDPEALGQAAEAGLRFADENFARSRVAMNINGVVRKVIGARSS
jgi:colanic acid biosynthesis glycosyl transferase WcaI